MNVKIRSTALAAALMFAVAAVGSADPILDPESRLWLVGDSTLHAYTSRASEIDVAMKVEPPAPLGASIRNGGMKALKVRVPVAGLKSGKKALDNNLRKALKADKNPDILFEMSSYEVVAGTVPAAFKVKCQGVLTVAGAAKPIDLVADVADGEIVRIQGSEDVLMTDHGVKPPSFMGAVKTHDRVVVNFDLKVK